MNKLKTIIGSILVISSLLFLIYTTYDHFKKTIRPYTFYDTVNDNSFYPEGPYYYNGVLYYTEYSTGKIMQWKNEENKVFWINKKCGPTSLMIDKNNNMLVSCYDTDSIVKISLTGKILKTIRSDKEGNPLNGPNDFTADSKGGIYFTASGEFDKQVPASGKIYYIRPDGTVVKVADDLHYPNGIALAPAKDLLYVNEHLAQQISVFKVLEDCSLGPKELFINLNGYIKRSGESDTIDCSGPDGLKIDSKGNLFCCLFGVSDVFVINPTKNIIREIVVKGKYVTNLCFGENESTLFITTTIDALKKPFPGKVYLYKRK